MAALLCVLLVSCGTCGDHVAELEMQSGRVERDEGSTRGRFVPAEVGDRFEVGDGLRTGKDGLARLTLVPDGVALVEANTLIRFFADDDDARKEHIALEEGVVQLEAAPLDLEVHTPRAIAKLSRGGKLRISTKDGEERFDVLVGRVAIAHDGTQTEVSMGQAFAIERADAVAAAGPDAAGTGATPSSDDAPPAEAAKSSVTEGDAAPPGRVRPDLALPGEVATLHTPEVPIGVRVPLPPCAESPSVEIESGPKRDNVISAAGAGSVDVALGAGNHRLRVRCGAATSSETSVRVQRDAATLELPRTAPRVDVDADGRRYTVQYQNVLPVVTLTWRDARPARVYSLVLRKGAREQRYPINAARKELRSGELGEGEHHFLFEAEGGQRSRESVLRIVFDNSARTAYLSEPALGARRQGATVVVAGAALARSEVSVAGQPVTLDPQGRFRAEVPVAPDQRSVAVRVRHPVSGIHYYLRRID